MKNTINRYLKPVAVCSMLLVMMMASCKQDEYYKDGGKANPVFNGTVLDYLKSNPAKFDTIAQIVKLAGLEDMFTKDDITFFAPTDETVRRSIGLVNTQLPNLKDRLNQFLFLQGKDTIRVLSDIPQGIWRKYLLRYVFKGKYVLKDYPQLDYELRELFPGGYFYTANNDLANIGVVFNGVNGVKYTGYRQLAISFIRDASNPLNFIPAAVATSDVQPSNGVVHVLAVAEGATIGEAYTSSGADMFGFGTDFWNDVSFNR